ncbi:hypothetical protein [Halapricum sp. CBA1109]|uniref:hypothetical protein n=1 Tax=Halapricum sp. CBA1109 TaxID=2668068 RepID=UPI0018D25977|nr:hypothetical protein [Halapricum sp. CBA1109]
MSSRRVAAVPVAVVALAAAGLVALDTLTGLGRPTVLRAGFGFVAAVLAAALFYGSRTEREPVPRVPAPVLTRVVLALCGGAVIAAELLGSRLLPFAVALPVGTLLVAAQLRADPSVPSVLTQVAALVAAPALGKYVTTGFYFGGTDTFAHVGAVQRLFESGTAAALPHGYDFYPVFHYVVGTVAHVTGLPAYDTIVLSGIALFTLTVPVVYRFGRWLLGSPRLGLCCAAALPLFEFVHYHALYFFPQALAVVLLFVGFEVNARLLTTGERSRFRRLSLFLLALVVTMVPTHHLTYILLAALLVFVAVPVAVLRGRFLAPSRLGYRWLFAPVVGGVLLLAYWAYTPSSIIVGIVQLSAGVVLNVVAVPGQLLFNYGVTLPADSVALSVQWLTTPTGVYAIGLATLLLLAGYELLDRFGRYRRGTTLAVTGLVAAGLLLPLPIPIPQIERLQFVVVLLAVIPLGIGLGRAVRVDRRTAVLALVVVAATGGATAFTTVAADDLRSSVYLEEPSQQVELTDAEYRSLQRTAVFGDQFVDGRVASDHVTRRAFETTDYRVRGTLRPEADGIRTARPSAFVLARQRWAGNIVPVGDGLQADSLRSFLVSRERFRAADDRLDKPYTTGHTRLYHDADGFGGLYNDSAR